MPRLPVLSLILVLTLAGCPSGPRVTGDRGPGAGAGAATSPSGSLGASRAPGSTAGGNDGWPVAPDDEAADPIQIAPEDVPRNEQRLRPTEAGLYRYEVTRRAAGAEQGIADSLNLRVEHADPGPGDRAQLHVYTLANDPPLEFHYLWRGGSLAVRRERQGDNDCMFDPRVVTLLLPLKVGATWSTDTTCENGSRPARRYEGRVLRAEERTVAGRRLRTFVLEKRILEGGAVVDEQRQWFSPQYRLVVRIERRGTTLSTQQIQNLRPE